MIVSFVKGIFRLGFCAAGLVAGLVAWDYMQQVQAADYQYSIDEYKLSVMDRYGEEAVLALSMLESAQSGVKAGARFGLQLAEDTGLLDRFGLSLTQSDAPPPVAPSVEAMIAPDTELQIAPVQFAVASQALAPESSLFPRARALR